MKMETNTELQLAYDFVAYTNKHIFLTGRAGTGKTTFLKHLKQTATKRMVIVAPTGVAAINAGGVTIHSFFQVPFSPYIPGVSSETFTKQFRKNKLKLIRSLDLLVIDEISMVRADLLDAINTVLQSVRRNKKPFGGVQLLMIGDLQQLPPVVKDDEWELLKTVYQTPFFFGSLSLNQTDYITIELKQIFRQKDEEFIRILNRIRNNDLNQKSIDLLNTRYQTKLTNDNEDIIRLTTHNYQANQINEEKMSQLTTEEYVFTATIKGDFPEWSFPVDKDLKLKVGAQVMFAKNDPEPDKAFYNGKIGKIVSIFGKHIFVKCPGDDFNIEVKPLDWEALKYDLDEDTKEIKEEILGVFTQYPLKLAWAITIHKSQGLTFEKAIIDAQAAFAHGQVYVALSRCKSLDGLVLTSPINPFVLHNDESIKAFTDMAQSNQPDIERLQAAKIDYQREQLIELYNFSTLIHHINRALRITEQNSSSVIGNALTILTDMREQAKLALDDVAIKFHNHLNYYLSQGGDIEQNPDFQGRVMKSQIYFEERLQDVISENLLKIQFETDNKDVKKQFLDAIRNLKEELYLKVKCFEACKNGFFVKDVMNAKARAQAEDIEVKPKEFKAAKAEKMELTDELDNPELFDTLKRWRRMKAEELSVKAFQIFHTKTLISISNLMPLTMDALAQVKGIGKAKLETYGDEILEIIRTY